MAANHQVKAKARATVTIEIDVDSTWGSDCAVDQIQKQASESAIELLRQRNYTTIGDYFHHNRARVVGAPVVTVILVSDAS